MRGVFAVVAGSVGIIACSLFTDVSGFTEEGPADARGPDVAESMDAVAADAPLASEIGTGSGKDGALDVTSEITINEHATITVTADAGQRAIDVERADTLVSGDVVLVWQTTGASAIASGHGAQLFGPSENVGRFELAGVASIEGNRVVLDRPLVGRYAASVSQVVRVPQFSSLRIAATGTLAARPWDGQRGGILALLVAGSVVNEGKISARAAGFRGGPGFASGMVFASCPALDGLPENGYSPRGEGLLPAAYAATAAPTTPSGRGNVWNGGGGGNCNDSGGGGGGNAGPGGKGGLSYELADVGGIGGVALASSARERLFMGGGGGSGASDAAVQGLRPGGAGGGVVFLRAKTLDLRGAIDADGFSSNLPPVANGGGGGGAGGAVFVALDAPPICTGDLHARGGNGGACFGSHGPGGGGGGGRVRLEPKSECTVDVAGGKAGIESVDGGASRGATSGTAGVVEAP